MLSRIMAVPTYSDSASLLAAVERALDLVAPTFAQLRQMASPLVVIKPNWIQHAHDTDPETWEPLITHPAVVAAVVEATAKRLSGNGTIAICDSPTTYAEFDEILRRGGFREEIAAAQRRHPTLKFEVLDLRREVWVRKENVVVDRRKNSEDPRGYTTLDLGENSTLFGHSGEGRYYGADYDATVVNEHHRGRRHEYLIAKTAMACDLFINVPKLKTHKKTGITCAMKNLVGINGDKNWLPHFASGSPKQGGDEYQQDRSAFALEAAAKRLGRYIALRIPVVGTWLYRKLRNAGVSVLGDSDTVVRSGNWDGNDTCWRMVLDLNRAVLYGSPDGSWRSTPRAYLAIVDGIVAGEGNGPLCPDAVAAGVLVAGTNPAEVDAIAARLMGFAPADLPIVRNAFTSHRWPLGLVALESVVVQDERAGRPVALHAIEPAVHRAFKPHFGWPSLLQRQSEEGLRHGDGPR
jgi:uncharacterized protein (DUF362 family)